jgi:protein-disulfide isomerase
MAVFEDFRCPHCKDFSEGTAPPIIADYVDSGQVRYEHRDLPVVDEKSTQAANAARSVQDEVGVDAFWSFSERLFAEQSAIGVELYRSAADSVGATPDTVVNDAIAQTYQPVIDADRQLARDKDVRGTPTVMVDGTIVERTEASIRVALDAALGK